MRARRLTAIAAVTVVVAVGAGACGRSSSEPPATAPDGRSSAADTSTAPDRAQPASTLAFTSPAIGGGTVDGATFQGRPTLVWFWSPW